MGSKPVIVVDADSCPVKQQIQTTANELKVRVIMVASYDHLLAPGEGVEVIQVDRSDQSVDLYIANAVSGGDIVITGDFGLACLVIGKGAIVLSPRGEQYTEDNIDYLMDRRHESARRRRAGGKTRGPRAMSEADRQNFQQKLTKVLREQQEKCDL